MTRYFWYSAVMLGLLLSLWLGACAVQQGTVYDKDGTQYGVTTARLWRARWWNYYERALSYAAGSYWPEAIADLHQAIKQRRADQRRARTYGLHLLDYFPHRELGIIYYELGRHDDAIRELETSLASVDTAKAKFYLNKARQGQLEQSQADVGPPRLVVDSPAPGLVTKDLTLTVQGHVDDDTYVSAIAVNGQAQFIELAQPRLVFRHDLTLHDGVNTIDIVAVDLLGKLVRQQLVVTLDRHGPLVSLEAVERLGIPPSQRVRITGLLSDHGGIVRFRLADRQLTPPAETEWEFREEVPLTPGMTSIPFEVEDTVGNVVRGTIALVPTVSDATGTRQGHAPFSPLTRWAARDAGLVMADVGSAGAAPLHMAQRADTHPPVIKPSGLAAQQTTYFDTFYLEGEVKDAGLITAFTINGESLWRRDSQQIFFGYVAVLQPGDNHFVLEATDNAGNTARTDVTITRQVEAVKRREARLRVTLMPLEIQGEAGSMAQDVYDRLLNALVNQQRFDLIERAQLDAVLREHKLSQTALIDPHTAVKIGKIVAAEGMLLGSVTETPKALEVLLRVVDVETATILAATDVYGEDVTLPALGTLMEGLALKVRQQFPLVQGLVLKTEGQKVFLDLHPPDVKKYMRLIVFRDGEPIKHPITGKLLGAPTEVLGEVMIETVAEDFSQGILRRTNDAATVQQLDKVMTK